MQVTTIGLDLAKHVPDSHEAARVHHAGRRCGRLAARSARSISRKLTLIPRPNGAFCWDFGSAARVATAGNGLPH
jgi:hypothetical protein